LTCQVFGHALICFMARSRRAAAVAGGFLREGCGCGVVRAMRLVTVLNRCYHFKGFVYEQARFCRDHKDAVVERVRAREGSRPYCSGCGKRCAGYDRLPERRFEFIPLWEFAVFFLYARRRVQCRDCEIVAGLPLRRLGRPAGKFMDRWCTAALRSRIKPMKSVARMIRRHRELILNWFRAKGAISNGVVEGLNNKAKLTMRKSYGFRSPEVLEIALLHALWKLPEPKLAHEFW